MCHTGITYMTTSLYVEEVDEVSVRNVVVSDRSYELAEVIRSRRQALGLTS